ncbi:MAG: PEP-CTERM sorting domain-containing protein [Rhodoferax sp.]|nr:PEP-CTERM sorting domain-containing protein [Rhodoferax sp.]
MAAASVPEPETLLLAFTALAGLGFVRRRQTVGALAI